MSFGSSGLTINTVKLGNENKRFSKHNTLLHCISLSVRLKLNHCLQSFLKAENWRLYATLKSRQFKSITKDFTVLLIILSSKILNRPFRRPAKTKYRKGICWKILSDKLLLLWWTMNYLTFFLVDGLRNGQQVFWCAHKSPVLKLWNVIIRKSFFRTTPFQ